MKWMFPKMMVITPKSSILIGISIINHPFWGKTPYFWKHPNIPSSHGCVDTRHARPPPGVGSGGASLRQSSRGLESHQASPVDATGLQGGHHWVPGVGWVMGDGWVMDVGCWVGYCGTIYKNWLGATQIYIYIYFFFLGGGMFTRNLWGRYSIWLMFFGWEQDTSSFFWGESWCVWCY